MLVPVKKTADKLPGIDNMKLLFAAECFVKAECEVAMRAHDYRSGFMLNRIAFAVEQALMLKEILGDNS